MKVKNPFYATTKWKRVRSIVLRRDEYMCRHCKRYGKTQTATTVHHIHPLETHAELSLASWNLLSLCDKCHNSMHDRTTHELTEIGLFWKEKIKEISK